MMHTEPITLDRAKARELYRAYRKHSHYSTPVDQECQRAYQLLAQGRLVIKALESIMRAGLNDRGLPKLAIARADATECRLFGRASDGSATMSCDTTGSFRRSNSSPSRWFDFPPGSFPGLKVPGFSQVVALVPAPPLHLRPHRGVESYHILFEAEWSKVIPRDPYLLRRIGKGDMWLVVAMWELTEVERTALAARISA